MITRATLMASTGILMGLLLGLTVTAWGRGITHQVPQDGQFGSVLPSPEEHATYPKALPPGALAGQTSSSAPTPPVRFTIPDTDLPPVQAQGTTQHLGSPGSCEVWSAGYALGSYTANLTNQRPIKDLDNTVSAAFVYAFVLAEEGHACPKGTKPSDTLNYLVDNTAPSLLTVPYQPLCSYLGAIDVSQSCDNNPDFCTELSIGSWSTLGTSNGAAALADSKGYLAQSRLVQITIVVPWQFPQYTSGVYDAPAACPASPPPGGPKCAQFGSIACIADASTGTGCAQHGVVIVGYDDTLVDGAGTPGALRIMNSFGTGWGEQGFMWMSYATFQAIYRGGTLAEPPPPATTPGLVITEAFQSVDHRAGQPPRVHLVFQARLEAPVTLGEVSITAPDATTVTQTHGHSFRSGPLYITRHDGRQFEPGLYTLRARGTTRGGVATDHTATVRVELAVGETLAAGPVPPGVTGTNGGPVR